MRVVLYLTTVICLHHFCFIVSTVRMALSPNIIVLLLRYFYLSTDCRLSYLIQNFQGGEVIHLVRVRLCLHVASSFSVDAFMPRTHRTHNQVSPLSNGCNIYTLHGNLSNLNSNSIHNEHCNSAWCC